MPGMVKIKLVPFKQKRFKPNLGFKIMLICFIFVSLMYNYYCIESVIRVIFRFVIQQQIVYIRFGPNKNLILTFKIMGETKTVLQKNLEISKNYRGWLK
jgi:hypothetical protein